MDNQSFLKNIKKYRPIFLPIAGSLKIILFIFIVFLLLLFSFWLGLNRAGGDLDENLFVSTITRLSGLIDAPNTQEYPVKIKDFEPNLNLTAKSAIVIDKESGKILYEKNPEKILPIASLTKLMTAAVFLETNPDGRQKVTIQKDSQLEGAKIPIKPGEQARIKDLFYAGLIASANNIVKSFVDASGIPEPEFVNLMNKKAEELGLKDTHFAEPTGIDANNESTAYDIARLIKYVFSNSTIQKVLLTEKYPFETIDEKKTYWAVNTNKLLNQTDLFEITGGKTGSSDDAGYCLAVSVKNKEGHEIIAVLLGTKSDAARFAEMREIIAAIFGSYQWPQQ